MLGDGERDELLTSSDKAPTSPPFRCGLRHAVLGLCALCAALCYADRTNLSVALIAMRREHGWPASVAGSLLSAFFWGYIVTQIPGGQWAARFGAQPTLITGVLLWSALTIATPSCASSVTLLFAIRVLVGLAEGVAMPCLVALVAAWAPPLERSRSLALVGSGAFVGTVSAYSCASLVDAWWPGIFYLFGSLGVLWAAAFQCVATSAPAAEGVSRRIASGSATSGRCSGLAAVGALACVSAAPASGVP